MDFIHLYRGVGSSIENATKEWLYGPWSKEKLGVFEALYAVPGVRHYMDYLLDIRANEEYLRRYGMDYSSLHDPRKLSQVRSGSSLVGYSYNFVSKNVSKLYD